MTHICVKSKLTSLWLQCVSNRCLPQPNQSTVPRHADYKLRRWVNSYGSFHSVLEGHQRWQCTWSSLLWLLNLSLRLSATIKLRWDKTLAKKSECHNKAVCVAVQLWTLSELCGAPVSCFLNELMVTVTIDLKFVSFCGIGLVYLNVWWAQCFPLTPWDNLIKHMTTCWQ